MTRGGRRPGAGRPRGTGTGRAVKPVQLHLPPELIAAVDAVRRSQSRSEWVAAALSIAVHAHRQWPASIALPDGRYHATGKVGYRADGGVACAEYELDGARAWLDALGAVRPG